VQLHSSLVVTDCVNLGLPRQDAVLHEPKTSVEINPALVVGYHVGDRFLGSALSREGERDFGQTAPDASSSMSSLNVGA
jgi:hypothetical protein